VAKNGSNRSAPEIDASFDFFEVRSESIGVKPSPPSAGSREPTPPSARTTEPTQEKIDNAAIVRKAIAGQLNKKPDELTTEDYEKTTVLGLSSTPVSDLTPIKALNGLKKLYLSGTKLSDEQVAELKKALPKLTIIR
jgi:hypothetical protein